MALGSLSVGSTAHPRLATAPKVNQTSRLGSGTLMKRTTRRPDGNPLCLTGLPVVTHPTAPYWNVSVSKSRNKSKNSYSFTKIALVLDRQKRIELVTDTGKTYPTNFISAPRSGDCLGLQFKTITMKDQMTIKHARDRYEVPSPPLFLSQTPY